MVHKIIIYTGAPESGSLDWDPAGLVSDFEESIARFVGLNQTPSQQPPAVEPSAPNHAVWRSLSLENTRAHTGFSQQFTAEFFTTAAVSFSLNGESLAPDQQELDTEFYETSFAAHQQEDIPSSKLVAAEESQITAATTSFQSTTTDNTTTASFLNDDSIRQPLQLPAGPGGGDRLSDLDDIPTARYLVAIQPQTMTINLVVGLISISPARTIKARRGSTHRLIEVVVGDETRAGFAITFWLPSYSTSGADETTTQILTTLRPCDIVLLQNVALNVFTGKVYGSSLRRNLTRVYLLHRATLLDAADAGGYYTSADLRAPPPAAADRQGEGRVTHPQLDKTRRVRDWVVRFVGQDRRPQDRKKGTSNNRRAWDVMPPVDDTQ